MALLHYQNIVDHRPDILMERSVRGLQVFYEFLTRTKEFMESDASVMRLRWTLGSCPSDEDSERHTKGLWVELIEPQDRPSETEAAFRAFLDENVHNVYELTLEDFWDTVVQNSSSRYKFTRNHRIQVLDRDPETQQICLERMPDESSQLILQPNTWTIECQRKALMALQDKPKRDHLPLLRLFESHYHAKWDEAIPASINDGDWMVLRDSERNGTDEQRQFVEIALNTPDFALLEGPPGSGKTTAICELILQLAKREKRILLCGSTHIAVDNVLERLMDKDNCFRDTVIPVRIGDHSRVSEKARPWRIDEFVKTERNRILKELNSVKNPTASQSEFKKLLEQGSGVIERMVLDAANLVCGTTIGILQHPDIRAQKGEEHSSINPEFDVLIIDEASKTTFQEFLVPALWAKRWIIVGDPKQLSPYVDDEAMAVNIEACLRDEEIRNACIDTFLAANRYQPRVAAVATTRDETKRAYLAQCEEHNVDIADADQEDGIDMQTASIVIGKEGNLLKRADELPLDITTIRDPDNTLQTIQRRADAWQRLAGKIELEQPRWASQVGWRTVSLYALRLTNKSKTRGDDRDDNQNTRAKKLERDINKLLPVSKLKQYQGRCFSGIERVQRVALPSILESLQNGFGPNKGQRNGTALSDGLPDWVREQRHVLLSTQHRMHPEIAEFSHEHIYDREALITPQSMTRERDWSYPGYRHRAIWIHVPAKHYLRNNTNSAEANQIVDELRRFDEWAETNPNPRGENAAWEVAVLTFYRGQEREIRKHLRKWRDLRGTMRHFYRGTKKRPYMAIELCTVDRFQGHEADLVLISFVNHRPTTFLESPNRLNVALTRARYQRVAIGDRNAMAKGERDGVLQKFAKSQRRILPIK